jgi:hypothetical protein
MVRLAVAAITSFSYVPLQLATVTGFVLATVSLLAIILTIILRLSGSSFFLGQATTLVSVLFLGGVQLIFLGIMGEYLGRIYDEVKNRPLYIVTRAYGFIPETDTSIARAVAFPAGAPLTDHPPLSGQADRTDAPAIPPNDIDSITDSESWTTTVPGTS